MLICVFFSYAQEDLTVLGSSDSPVDVLGFCAGEIPGAVAVAARDIEEIAGVAVEVVRLMFRFYQEMMARTIQADSSSGSWGVTVMGATRELAQEILDDFHNCEASSPHHCPAWGRGIHY